MNDNFHFDPSAMQSVVGGRSALDTAFLGIKDLEGADAFLKSYGFDPENEIDIRKLWYFHRRAYVLMTDKLGFVDAEIPEIIKDPKVLEDLRRLMIFASDKSPENRYLQKWACALLRCMHVYVHDESDLFNRFSEEIQAQILVPLQSHILYDGTKHEILMQSLKKTDLQVPLYAFEEKPFKTSSSTVIKLLAKPDVVALKVFDKVGVRFVTDNIFDCFRVARFLVDENIISYPHIMPDQSSNNVYPLDLFLSVCEDFKKDPHEMSNQDIQNILDKKLSEAGEQSNLFRKENKFSGSDYKFIKFISRKLIHISIPGAQDKLSFFYPYEVQIMEKTTYEGIRNSASEHQAYKDRQILAAKQRLYKED